MKIYLVRHGESVPEGDDNERSLTKKGMEDVKKLAHFIDPLHIHVAKILQSEKCRAQQTASILSSSVQFNMIETYSELDLPKLIRSMIKVLYAEKIDLMLVGHLPYLEHLVGWLVVEDENKRLITFKTATMVCLEQKDQLEWVISWMINPELLGSVNNSLG